LKHFIFKKIMGKYKIIYIWY